MTFAILQKIEPVAAPKIVVTQYGGRYVEFDDDATEYYLESHQKWLPHCVTDLGHPAKIGDHVALSKWLSEHLGFDVGIVSGVRTFKRYKNSVPNRQIELLGLPLRWFSIGHFDDYHDRQIPDRRWIGWTIRFEY